MSFQLNQICVLLTIKYLENTYPKNHVLCVCFREEVRLHKSADCVFHSDLLLMSDTDITARENWNHSEAQWTQTQITQNRFSPRDLLCIG